MDPFFYIIVQSKNCGNYGQVDKCGKIYEFSYSSVIFYLENWPVEIFKAIPVFSYFSKIIQFFLLSRSKKNSKECVWYYQKLFISLCYLQYTVNLFSVFNSTSNHGTFLTNSYSKSYQVLLFPKLISDPIKTFYIFT